jgi:hypothetical protein
MDNVVLNTYPRHLWVALWISLFTSRQTRIFIGLLRNAQNLSRVSGAPTMG